MASKALAGVANMTADAQTAKWQARYGREPTDQQRAWLVNKVRTDIAMRATKLNAQVQFKFRPDLADDETKRAIQGAIPDIVYDDPKDDKQRVVELKFHSQCKTRY